MRILVLYFQRYAGKIRNTIDEHLYSFKRYSHEECYYLNVAAGIPWYVTRINFDLVIYHYTIIATKWNLSEFNRLFKKWYRLKQLKGYKIAIPQDEYVYSDAVNEFFKEFEIKTVFTCLPESDWQKVYPVEKSGLEHYVKVLTGYIDEEALKEISSMERIEKDIDIGYRARKLPYWLGRHGQLKWVLAKKFLNAGIKHNLKMDISTDYDDVFLGRDWYKFLLRCRTVLGCEGGATLHDPTGEIRRKVEGYVLQHPDPTFEEVEKKCFPGLDGNLKLFALSPRHFECCITKTCQVLVEGEYAGIFKPCVHYIEIKKDWSNIVEIIKKIEDKAYCEQIAENAYRDIVGSGLYTYRKFVKMVIAHVLSVSGIEMHPTQKRYCIYLGVLQLREKFSCIFLFPYYLVDRIILAVRNIFGVCGLLPYYEKFVRLIKRETL